MVLATPHEAHLEYARNAGAEEPERAWILTPQDAWARNPYYSGPPVPHPEDDEFYPEQWQEEMILCQDMIETGGPWFNNFQPCGPDDEIPY